MKHNIFLLLLTLLLASCSSVQPISHDEIATQAARIVPNQQVILAEIPSHGLIADSLMIALDGGANATQIGEVLTQLSENGGGGVVLRGNSPALIKANIKGAISSINSTYDDVWLIYVGSEDDSNSIKPIVESAGLNYGFIESAY